MNVIKEKKEKGNIGIAAQPPPCRSSAVFFRMAEKINHALDRLERIEQKRAHNRTPFFERLAEAELAKIPAEKKSNVVIEALCEIKLKLLGKKRKLLAKIGVDEKQLLESFGVENSFKLAKLGSKLDVVQELVSLALGTVALGIASSVLIKTGLPSTHELAGQNSVEAWARNLLHNLAPYLKVMFAFLLPAALCARLLNRIGAALDVLQHILMESIANALPKSIQPSAQQTYKQFSRESVREIVADSLISIVPLPFADSFRRIRAIKLELRQLGYIVRMEKLFHSAQEAALKEKGAPEGAPQQGSGA